MLRPIRWLVLGVFLIAPLTESLAQVVKKFNSNTTYRELNPITTDGCSKVLCHYHPMETWGNDFPIKDFAYRGMIDSGVVEFMNWRILFPIGYNKTNPTKYPMIIMLHGAGEGGRLWSGNFNYPPNDVRYDNNDANVIHGGKEHQIACGYSYQTGLPSGPVAWPGIVIWPQVSYNGAWEGGWNNGAISDNNRMASVIIEYLINNWNVDPDRIAIHGLSNGAQGVWDLASKRPDLFAAMLPMSGVASNYDAQTDVLVTTPTWLFQGGLDTNPNPQASLDLINMLIAKGGNPIRTVYPTLAHGTWTTAYAEPNFFPFMLAANKKNIYVFGGDPSICIGGSLKLGVSAGYAAYQWTKDGVDIPGANSRYYSALYSASPAVYSVRMTRPSTVLGGSVVTSNPVTIVPKTGSSFVPALSNTGSVNLTVDLFGINNDVTLTAPLGYTNYNWLKNHVPTTTNPNTTTNTRNISNNTGAAGDAGVYTVTVLQATGCTSAESNPVTVFWNATQPVSPKPNPPTFTNISSTSTQLDWTAMPAEAGFEVWRQQFSTSSPLPPYNFHGYALIAVLPAGTHSYIDNTVRPGGKFKYRVRALHSSGGATFSDDSDFWNVSLDTSPPTAPTNLAATTITDTQITLTWSPSIDNDLVYKYEVYNGSTLVATLTGGTEGSPLPATSTNLTGLTANTSYLLNVRAIDYSGNVSTFADGLSVTTTYTATGVTFKYWEFTGNLANLASFNFNQAPKTTGTTNNFNNITVGGARADQFVFSFESMVQIDVAGTYNFFTSSDDGSMLYINNDNTAYKTIVSNDGQHGTTKVSGTCTFGSTGKFPIKVTYFEQAGGQALTVTWSKTTGSGTFAEVAIPDAKLSYFTTPTFANTWYLRTSGTPETAGSWSPNPNGTGGSSPGASVFSTASQQFIITNQGLVSMNGTWNVSGAGSKVVIASGSTLTLGGVMTGTLDAKSGSILNVNNASMPQFGNLDAGSTINFTLPGTTTLPNDTYGNVGLANNGGSTYSFPFGSMIVNGNLSVNNGVTTTGSINNQSVVTVSGNITFNNNPNTAASNRTTLKFTGGSSHTITLATPVDLSFFSIIADFGDAVQLNNGTGHTLTLGSTSGGGLILRSGATLNLGDGTLSLNGNSTINPNNETGILAMNGGSLSFLSSTAQNSTVYFSNTANAVNNLTTSTPAGSRLSLQSSVNIKNLMTVSGGEFNSNAGSLTLISDATGSARVGPITGGGKITGSITEQRYMQGKGRIYRYISSPVKGLSVATLQQYIPVTGNFTGANTGTGLGSAASMFWYSEPNYNGFPAAGGTNADTLRRGRGYAIFVREPTLPTTWVATGTPYQGTIPFALTPGSGLASDGWNLVGNPYPSPIAWTGSSSGGWTMTNVGSTVYVRENMSATQYEWRVYRPGIIPGPGQALLANGVIAAGQAFWVQTTAAPALTISESAKYTPNGGTLYRTGTTEREDDAYDVLGINLSNGTLNDATYIFHDDHGTDNYEKLEDAVKQPNSFFNLSTKSADGVSLVINSTPATFCEKNVALNIENAAVGNYSLTFFGLEKFQRPVVAELHDNFLGTSTPITEGSTYSFAITSDASSAGSTRFVISEELIVITDVAMKTSPVCEGNPSITLLSSQDGVQYQALLDGAVVSDTLTSDGSDSVKLTLSRKALGFGTHTVTLIGAYPGCDKSNMDKSVNITVDTLQVPVIRAQSGFLVVTPTNADHYQWLFDGSPIKSKTNSSLMFNSQPGIYQVEVSVGACDKVSTPFDITSLENTGSLIRVFPNPFRDQIAVTLPEKIQGGTAMLTNTMGQKVQSAAILPQDSNEVIMNFAGVESGVYILNVGRYKFKVIKN